MIQGMGRRKLKSADEYDAHTKWRHVLIWRPGERSKIKRRTRRRERHEAHEQIRKEHDERHTDEP